MSKPSRRRPERHTDRVASHRIRRACLDAGAKRLTQFADETIRDGVTDAEIIWTRLTDPGYHDFVLSITKPPAMTGRPEKYPLIAITIIGLLVRRGARRAAAVRYVRENWPKIRKFLAKIYDDYPGLEPGAKAPTADDYRRYAKRHCADPYALSDGFRAYTATKVPAIGIGDPSGGTLAFPVSAAILRVDGVVETPLYSTTPGSTRLDKTTGELVPRRFERDANFYTVGGSQEQTHGLKEVIASASTDAPNSTVILDIRPCKGVNPADEATVGVGMLADLKALYPGMTHNNHDKAMRGKHMTQCYDLDLIPIVKGYDGKTTASIFLETATIRKTDGTTDQVDVYAFEYGFHVQAFVAGNVEFVYLPTVEVENRPNKKGPPRKYCILRIPDDDRLPQEWVGGKIRIRPDTTERDRQNKVNRSENIRVHAPHTVAFTDIDNWRNIAENANRIVKAFNMDDRARALGTVVNHFDLIMAGVCRNTVAEIIHTRQQRLKAPSADPPSQLAA